MVHDRCPNLISFQIGYEPFSRHAKFQWWLAGSFLLHLFAILAIHLNVSLPMRPVLTSYQVALISDSSVSQDESPKVTPVSQPTQPSASPKSDPHVSRRESHKVASVSVPAQPAISRESVARERLSDSLSGALQSVVVPKQREVPKVSQPHPQVSQVAKTEEKARAATQEALRGITLPPEAPKLAAVKPLVPNRPEARPQQERLSEALKQTVQSISVPTQRPSRLPRDVQPSVTHESAQAREELAGIKLPSEAPTLSAVEPLVQRRPIREAEPRRERLLDTLKQTVQSISIPTQREAELSEHTQQLLVPKTANATKADMEARKAAQEALTGITLPQEAPQLGAVKLDRAQERNDEPNFERANTQIDRLIESLPIPEVANIPQLSVGFEPQIQESQGSQEATSREGKRGNLAKGLLNPDLGRYSNQIRGAVQRIWRIENVGLHELSAGQMGQEPPRVVVKFQVQRSGKVTGVAIEQVSGSEAYDQAALRVVQKVSPLPPIPASITAQYLDVHFTFTVERKDG